MKKYIYFTISLLTLFLVAGSAAHASVRGEPPRYVGLGEFQPDQGPAFGTPGRPGFGPNPNGPVITEAYALNKGKYGTPLKIYLKADDPKGEMSRIAVTVNQTGYGHYPTDFIILKSEYREHFKGYIQWNTFSSHAQDLDEWTQITVTVSVLDKNGRESNRFSFPFSFETGIASAPTPPPPFNQTLLAKLGNVDIDLYNPYKDGGDHFDRDR